jgi:hypothetical protein
LVTLAERGVSATTAFELGWLMRLLENDFDLTAAGWLPIGLAAGYTRD